MSTIKDRIKDFRRVPASAIKPNAKNWRTHPHAQRDALKGVLAEIGIADALLVRELADGTLELVDGHLRHSELGDQDVPVLVLDLDEAEADKLLVLFDPLAAMAGVDQAALTALLGEVETSDADVQALLTELAISTARSTERVPPTFQPVSVAEQSRLDERAKVKCPGCGHEF